MKKSYKILILIFAIGIVLGIAAWLITSAVKNRNIIEVNHI